MSSPFNCKCPERKKPVLDRDWVIEQDRCNHSAFDGYRWTPSDYSTVRCLSCGRVGRTKAKYVLDLRLALPGEVEAARRRGWASPQAPRDGTRSEAMR
jgi:hypothetical protein